MSGIPFNLEDTNNNITLTEDADDDHDLLAFYGGRLVYRGCYILGKSDYDVGVSFDYPIYENAVGEFMARYFHEHGGATIMVISSSIEETIRIMNKNLEELYETQLQYKQGWSQNYIQRTTSQPTEEVEKPEVDYRGDPY